MKWELSPHVSLANDRIAAVDAARQQETAAEICTRLQTQPGVVLADEVGTGKTFVALAVAASAALAARRKAPVVVMVPTGVGEKWVKEWQVFRERCLASAAPELRATDTPVRNGTDFLRLLDDPPERRAHLIILTHGALSARMADPWVELAFVREALRWQRDVDRHRRAVARWSRRLFTSSPFTQNLAEELLAAAPRKWQSIAATHEIELGDDPVPVPVQKSLHGADLSAVRDAIWQVPQRESKYLASRLSDARKALRSSIRSVWPQALARLDVELPLLILDEAHHVKNDNQLAKLFANREAQDDAEALQGALGGNFQRMLFLTATPFQLGHRELLSVLHRFEGVRWDAPLDRESFCDTLEKLRESLDATQAGALRLERSWGWLSTGDGPVIEDAELDDPVATEVSDPVRAALEATRWLRDAMRDTEQRLRPWVIRHMRPDKNLRRSYRPGDRIQPANSEARTGGRAVGLDLDEDAALPFLLATRAEAIVALHGLQEDQRTNAFFAGGLSSTFEAYRDTRRDRLSAKDSDVRDVESDAPLPAEIEWYLQHIDRALPSADPGAFAAHPKVAAVIDACARLWRDGEKVLVFCFYVETGKALRAHVSRRLQADIVSLATERLKLHESDPEAVFTELHRLGDRIDADPLRATVEDAIRSRLSATGLDEALLDLAVPIVRRFLRTPGFLVRFVDLPRGRSLSADLAGPLLEALEKPDGSGASFAEKVTLFGEALSGMVDLEREEIIEALGRIQTGTIYEQGDVEAAERANQRDAFVPNVRLANGSVTQQLRRRLMLGFNSPFFPEVLVASAVMAEGIDLHLDCRHVIHHDLDWNPSTLEQRTGRVDRIGSKAQRMGKSIEIYEPFIAGMYDEKIYRVVKDRERWFNIVMGEHIDTSEWATDKTAARVPLPVRLQERLTFDLAVFGRP